MSSAGWRPTADEIAAELCRARAERVMAGLLVRVSTDAEALAVWLAGRASSVGVTSSDERPDCDGKGHDVGDPSAPCVTCHGDLTREQLAVPSSDEPEGDGLAGMEAVRERVATAIHNPLGHAMGGTLGALIDAAVEALEDAGVLADLLPVPVGDAEPVQWGLEDESGEIVGTARMRDDAESLAAELLGGLDLKVVPLFRLPVSSQDAGARAEGHDYSLLDAVLPAEGEPRERLISAAFKAPKVAQFDVTWNQVAVVFDALRAAAGKAGSDDDA